MNSYSVYRISYIAKKKSVERRACSCGCIVQAEKVVSYKFKEKKQSRIT